MTESIDDIKELLRQAEETIGQLAQENASLNEFINGLMEAQQREAEQMATLTEQMLEMEDALFDAAQENADLEAMLVTFRSGMTTLQSHLNETLESIKNNASRVDIAGKLHQVASLSDEELLDQRTAEYNARIAAMRGGG
jgi:chromosome segregation ATPase